MDKFVIKELWVLCATGEYEGIVEVPLQSQIAFSMPPLAIGGDLARFALIEQYKAWLEEDENCPKLTIKHFRLVE